MIPPIRFITLPAFGLLLAGMSSPPAPETISSNDNRHAAGTLANGVLTIKLEARVGVWHPEGDAGRAVELAAWSEEGKFRPDLYYRLGVFTIHLPPLRERDDDLLMLVQYYLRRFNRELEREVREVTPEGLERLRGYLWPGNVRELQSVLKQALLQASGPVLLPAFLPEPLGGAGGTARPAPPAAEPGEETFVIRQRIGADVRDLYAQTHRQVDRLLLPRVLEHTCGNLQQASLLLGIARQTLREKLRDLGLSVTRHAEVEEDDPV